MTDDLFQKVEEAEEMAFKARRLDALADYLEKPEAMVDECRNLATNYRSIAMVKLSLALGLGFPDHSDLPNVNRLDTWSEQGPN